MINKAVVVPASYLTAYTWKGAPIDDVGVIHSICAVGRNA
jgi:hypothetical protein